MGEVSGGERRRQRAVSTEQEKHLTAVQEPQKTNASLAWLQARVRVRSEHLDNRTTHAMLDHWRAEVSPDTAHIRELSGLPGTGHKRGLPIENHAGRIQATIRTKEICGVRSPPGSGKTMILPELLYDWAEDRAQDRWQKLHQAVMIVFPTQFGCLKIRDSLLEFRGHDYWPVNLGTGIDKNDRFHWESTKFQFVT